MDKAEFPTRQCKEAVWNEVSNAYPCELPDLHPGPCASFSVASTVQRRDAWEADHPDWRSGIGDLNQWT